MSRALFAAFVLLADVGASRGEGAKTDLYGDPLPPGAVMRLGTSHLRHANSDVVFSKNGKQLVSCGRDGEVRVWDVATGKLVRRQQPAWKPRENEHLFAVAVSPGEIIVATWDDKDRAINLYDMGTGRQRGRIPSVNIVRPSYLHKPFFASNKFLALQTRQNDREFIVQIWDVKSLTRYQTLAMPPGVKLENMAFSSDGKRVVGIANPRDDSGRRDSNLVDLFLWDTGAGKLLRERKNIRGIDLSSVVFSPDGKTLALGSSRSEAVVQLLAADTLKGKSRLIAPAAGSQDYLKQLVFSPDGRRLAASWGTSRYIREGASLDIPHDVLLWDLLKAKEPLRLPVRHETPLTFSPDSSILACRKESAIYLYDAASGRPLHNRPGHDQVGLALTVSADGKTVASGDYGGTLRLWDAATSNQIWKLEGRDLVITDCYFSADGKRVAAGNRGGPFFDFQAWDVAKGSKLGRISVHEEDGCLYAAAISADGKRFIGVYTKEANRPPAELIVWDVASGKRLSQRPYQLLLDENSTGTTGGAPAVFSVDGERLTVWLGDRLGIAEVSTGSLLAKLPKGMKWPSMFSPDGRLLMVMVRQSKEDGPDGEGVEVQSLIEAISGEEIIRLGLKTPNKIAFTSDGRGLAVSHHKNLCVWDTETGEKLYQMAWPDDIAGTQEIGGAPYVPTLTALPGGRVAASMAEGDIVVWDLRPSRWPKRKPKHELDRKELESLWSDLVRGARKAYPAMHALTASPVPTVAFFQEQFPPATDGKRIEKLLADLDSDSFSTREKASRELRRMPYHAEPMLRRALRNNPSLEMRCRIEPILTGPRFPSPEDLRTLRAIAVLERIGTPEARQVLEKLAGGAETNETREAKAALERLKRR